MTSIRRPSPGGKNGTISFQLLQHDTLRLVYDSVVTLAFAFVTFTPNCFAFATISTLFFDETACEILALISVISMNISEVDRVARTLLRMLCCA